MEDGPPILRRGLWKTSAATVPDLEDYQRGQNYYKKFFTEMFLRQ